MFAEKLDEAAKLTVETLGWKWAEASTNSYIGWYKIEQGNYARLYPVQDDLTEAETERYDELAEHAEGEVLDEAGEAELADLQSKQDGSDSDEQKAHSGVILYIDRDGRLRAEEGSVRPEDKGAARTAGVLSSPGRSDDAAAAAPKSPISQKLRDDLNRVVTGARQHAALLDPELVLALLAYQLTGKGGFWDQPFGIRTDDVANWPTTEAAGYTLDDRLTTPDAKDGDVYKKVDQARSFRAFKGKGVEKIMEDLHRHLAALLKPSEALAGVIDKQVDTSIREVWTPTAENFFSRVSGGYLNDLWSELLGLAAGHPVVTSLRS